MTDAHVHLAGSPAKHYTLAPHKENAKSSLRCGVTTVIDLFYPENECVRLRNYTARFPEKYSGVLVAGPIITAPGGHGTEYGVPTRTITSVLEARETTNEVIKSGVDVIKVVYEAHSNKKTITKEMLAAIVGEAHKKDKKVFVHINVAAEAMDCIDVNVDVLAHLPMDTFSEVQMSMLKQSGIVVIPTMSVMVSMFYGVNHDYLSGPLLWQTAHKSHLEQFDSLHVPAAPYVSKRYSDNVWHNLRQCVQHNIPIVAGTDAGNFAVFYGYSLHWELLYYVQAGMSPATALNTATRSLTTLFPELKTGVVQPGYYADLVILNKNPLKDINNTRRVHSVYHKGLQVKM